MRPGLHAAVVLVALSVSPSFAQTTTTTPGGTSGTTATRTVPVDTRSDDRDWGWLGLLGLIGLAPLFMRKDRQGNVHADTRR